MQAKAPNLVEFQNLFAVPIEGLSGFPPDLIRNADLVREALTIFTAQQREGLFDLLKCFLATSHSIWFTATTDDFGFRVGVKRETDAKAETVVARFFYPPGAEPRFDIYGGKIGKRVLAKQLDQSLLSNQDLSVDARTLADELKRAAPSDSRIQALLENDYNYGQFRRALAHRLPCSFPVAGLLANSDERRWRDAWRAA